MLHPEDAYIEPRDGRAHGNWGEIAVAILVAVMFVFATTTLYLLAFPRACEYVVWEYEERHGDIPLVLAIDKRIYTPGESVEFILRNVGSTVIVYDSELRETLQIFDPFGHIVVMRPAGDSDGLIHLLPGESISWVWDQTYYLWVFEKPGEMPTWSYMAGTPVYPGSNYTAKITFGAFVDVVKFSIIG